MPRLQRPLNAAAIEKADDDFYSAHPEFIGTDGKRIPLSATEPNQSGLRTEWRESYVAHGGPIELNVPPSDPNSAVQQCKQKDEPLATLSVKWSKKEVTPDHNNTFPPANEPLDTVPAEAKVELIGTTTNVPDGSPATMAIYHAVTGSLVANGTFTNLEIRGNEVVVADTGKPPEWFFDASHNIWEQWDRPFYYFRCEVSHQSLCKETPKDFVGREAECLRLIYWHECIAESSTLAGVLPECTNVGAILNGLPYSKAHIEDLTTENIPLAQYGSLLRNTYVIHQASHGNALKRSDNTGIPDDDPGEHTYVKSEWRSVVHIGPGPMRFGDAEIAASASIPSTPKYLFYSSTCLTGWEPTFADAMIARGTQYVLAFRRTIPDSEAPVMAEKFYKAWVDTHKLNPEKIPSCFFTAGADHYSSMKPILFGRGGGSILSPAEAAAKAISDAISGMLNGISSLLR